MTVVIPDVGNMIPPVSGSNGAVTVALAGTRQQLPNIPCKSALIRAPRTNTGDIYLGDEGVTAANGYPLYAREAVAVCIDNLNRLYIDASVNGEGIRYLVVEGPP